jgi:hypothetical protein
MGQPHYNLVGGTQTQGQQQQQQPVGVQGAAGTTDDEDYKSFDGNQDSNVNGVNNASANSS